MLYKTKVWEGRRMATKSEMIPSQVSFSGLHVFCCSWVCAFLLQKKTKTKTHSSRFSKAGAPKKEDVPMEIPGPWLQYAPWCSDWPLNHVHRHLGGGAWDRPILPAVTGVSRLLVIGRRANHVHAVLHPRGQVLPLSKGPIGRRRTE